LAPNFSSKKEKRTLGYISDFVQKLLIKERLQTTKKFKGISCFCKQGRQFFRFTGIECAKPSSNEDSSYSVPSDKIKGFTIIEFKSKLPEIQKNLDKTRKQYIFPPTSGSLAKEELDNFVKILCFCP